MAFPIENFDQFAHLAHYIHKGLLKLFKCCIVVKLTLCYCNTSAYSIQSTLFIKPKQSSCKCNECRRKLFNVFGIVVCKFQFYYSQFHQLLQECKTQQYFLICIEVFLVTHGIVYKIVKETIKSFQMLLFFVYISHIKLCIYCISFQFFLCQVVNLNNVLSVTFLCHSCIQSFRVCYVYV